jgi:hypothetical protein
MADTIKWACKVHPETKKATLTVARSDLGGATQSIRIKGVCYSPAPLLVPVGTAVRRLPSSSRAGFLGIPWSGFRWIVATN